MSKLTDRLLYAFFTVFLIIVIFGLVLPNIIGRAESAKIKAASSQIDRLAMAVETYFENTGEPPRALIALVENTDEAEGWNGPYVKQSILRDPWNVEYIYMLSEGQESFEIISLGADRMAGGDGNNADIRKEKTFGVW